MGALPIGGAARPVKPASPGRDSGGINLPAVDGELEDVADLLRLDIHGAKGADRDGEDLLHIGPIGSSVDWTDLNGKPASPESKVHGPAIRGESVKMPAAVGCGEVDRKRKRLNF